MIGFLVFLVILGIMVLIHEAGHFAAAKWCGVRVEAFAIGFGKRLFGVVHNGTDYRINLLPLGGYVKMAGQDEMPSSIEQTSVTSVPAGLEPYNAELERAVGGKEEQAVERREAEVARREGTGVEFTAVSRWKRMLIGVAGPVANFILAFVVLLGVALFHYQRAEYLEGPAVLDYVPTGSTAAKAGMQAGDTIVSINHHENPNWQDVVEQSMLNMKRNVPVEFLHDGKRMDGQLYIEAVDDPIDLFEKVGLVARAQDRPIGVHEVQPGTPAAKAGLRAGDQIAAIDGLQLHSVESLLSYLHDQGGKPAVLTVVNQGQTRAVPVTPEVGLVTNDRKQYRLGFRPEPVPAEIVRLPFGEAVKESWKQNVHNSLLIVQVLKGLFTRHVSVKNMSGPVGIEQQISDATKQGFWDVANLSSAISLNLGIFNLLPMPILDGGLILFLIIESLARRDVKPVIKEKVYQAAFVCILVFFAFVMWNDISRLVLAHRPS